jgi:hypothetical protein
MRLCKSCFYEQRKAAMQTCSQCGRQDHRVVGRMTVSGVAYTCRDCIDGRTVRVKPTGGFGHPGANVQGIDHTVCGTCGRQFTGATCAFCAARGLNKCTVCGNPTVSGVAVCGPCKQAAAAQQARRYGFGWTDDELMPPAPLSTTPPADSYFALLGLATTEATDAQIKAAYKLAARTAHPDAGGTRDAWDKLAEAYAVLRDPKRRKKYLLGLKLAGQLAAQQPPEPDEDVYTWSGVRYPTYGSMPPRQPTPQAPPMPTMNQSVMDDLNALNAVTMSYRPDILNVFGSPAQKLAWDAHQAAVKAAAKASPRAAGKPRKKKGATNP